MDYFNYDIPKIVYIYFFLNYEIFTYVYMNELPEK